MGTYKMRPYARLLSMLGDQLIKNATVALIELVKNAYDADASFCNVYFENFDENFNAKNDGRIRVEDNGQGMSREIIINHFLNPATPKKIETPFEKTEKGRIPQGEKGIGRFAMLKLGRNITVLSKEEKSDDIHKIIFDFGRYDDEFRDEREKVAIHKGNKNEALFLDQIDVVYEIQKISDYKESEYAFVKYRSGTTILIENLKGQWGPQVFDTFKDGILSFMPFELNADGDIIDNQDFKVELFRNSQIQVSHKEEKMSDLVKIITDKTLYKINGCYDEKKKTITFYYVEAKNKPQTVVINFSNVEEQNSHTEAFRGLSIYRDKGDEKRKDGIETYYKEGNTTVCGDFSFAFYIFDFKSNQYDKFGLNKAEKDLVRKQRVFLYRDDIRVQPYGAPNDDWLQIDRHRAETRASDSFSNDQIFGQIRITKEGNTKLRDKTSREGMIEDSAAFEQLITLVRGVLMYIRVRLYQTYLARQEMQTKDKNEVKITEDVEQLKGSLKDNESGLHYLDDLVKSITIREKAYAQRLEITEQLAGVGLSVEMASHDLMLTIDRLRDVIHQIYMDTSNSLTLTCNVNAIHQNGETAEGLIGLVYMKMRDLQQLFVSSKQRAKMITVIDIIKKIQSIYASAYNEKHITVEYETKGSPVKAKVIDAVLFQVFINLFDNALYWLQCSNKDRRVKITLVNQQIIFSDNGPGVPDSDTPFIFEAFYSGKGEEGRGLGLYIARKLLEKNDYAIDIITNNKEKILSGANFVISFIPREEEQ